MHVISFVSLLVLSSFASGQQRDVWRHFLHTESLAEPLDAQVYHFSSWARNGGNSDLGWYYGVDSHGWKIICDLQGPGVITDFWWHKFPSDPAWRWRIYVDDTTTALIDTGIVQLCGHVPPFEFPLADSSSNGFFSYVPIPFQSRIRITFSGQSTIYYHVTAHRYPTGTTVEPFQFPPSADYLTRLDSLRQRMLNPAQPIYLDNPSLTFGGQLPLPADSSCDWTYDGSGMTRRMLLTVSSHSQPVLENLWARIYTDGYPFPDLEGPLSELFAQPLGWHNYASLLTGVSGDTLYWNLPVFFSSHLRLELENRTGATRAAGIWAEIIDRSPTGLPPFRARSDYREENPTTEWQDYEFARFTGPGNYVGTLFDTQQDDPHVLEGDEKFWFDGELNPSWHGTGTEDYFKGGRYWYPAYAQLPEHGCIAYLGDSAAAYHWHLNDALPFDSSLRGATEVGRFGQMTGHYRTMAFAYTQPEKWVLRDADRSGASSPLESLRIVGRGLIPDAVVSDVAIGSFPAAIIAGSALVNADSILDVTIAAPETLSSGVYTVTATLDQNPVLIKPSWEHHAGPVLEFTPLRCDIDDCVFTGDTLEIVGHGFAAGAVVSIMSGSQLELPWLTPAPTGDALGCLHGFVTIPSELAAGDHVLSAGIDSVPVAYAADLLKNRDFYRLEVEILEKIEGLRFREESVRDYCSSNNQDPWGRDCARMLQGTGVGSYAVLEFYYPVSGWCHMEYFWAVCPAGAIMRTTIDSLVDLEAYDSYAPIAWGRWVRSDTVRCEAFYLPQGWHTLRVEIIGRDSSATDWFGILDQVLFVDAPTEGPTPLPPDRIRDLTIFVHDPTVELRWSHVRVDSLNNPIQPTSYQVFVSPNSDSAFTLEAEIPATDSVFIDSTGLGDPFRFYRVMAITAERGGGASVNSHPRSSTASMRNKSSRLPAYYRK